ncbi:MAG: DUF378 domain-containing protein [Armatimonadia bacterium]|nr:DUF378 domain-containing protein [Armatimonadia bacterium]
MKALNTIVLILVIVGGLNWGLVGVAEFDLVAAIFGDMSTISRVVYTLVGIAAIWAISFFGMLGGSAPAGRGPMAAEEE